MSDAREMYCVNLNIGVIIYKRFTNFREVKRDFKEGKGQINKTNIVK